jgi:hypothetical protein
MNRKNNKDNVAHLNKKSIFPARSQDQTPMEMIPEVEDEEETPTCPGLPSAPPLPLSNPLEQDWLDLIRPCLKSLNLIQLSPTLILI